MKYLIKKAVVRVLEKIEQGLLASVSFYEIGLYPAEATSLLPIVYTGIWETQYFNTFLTPKLGETTELPENF